MKSSEITIRRVHQRAAELQREREKRSLQLSGGISALLCIVLFAAAGQLDLHAVVSLSGSFAGSSLLSESAGGYVLVGVAAFMSGVILTVIIRKYLVSKEKTAGTGDARTEEQRPSSESDSNQS